MSVCSTCFLKIKTAIDNLFCRLNQQIDHPHRLKATGVFAKHQANKPNFLMVPRAHSPLTFVHVRPHVCATCSPLKGGQFITHIHTHTNFRCDILSHGDTPALDRKLQNLFSARRRVRKRARAEIERERARD